MGEPTPQGSGALLGGGLRVPSMFAGSLPSPLLNRVPRIRVVAYFKLYVVSTAAAVKLQVHRYIGDGGPRSKQGSLKEQAEQEPA